MKTRKGQIPALRRTAPLAAAVVAALAGAGAWLAGCAANDPFDASTVPNAAPVARIFVAPVDSGGDLAPTSYYRARFAWSGTDRDGWVQDYNVSLRTPADQDAPWIVTTTEDTVVTFSTDETGVTDARLLVVCRDDRGAYSDTASQYFAIRNFPPQIAMEADYNPLVNMQWEVIDGDTVIWNYGYCNFRFVVHDPDGAVTMDDFFRWTLADGDPDTTWDEDDPAADPELGWIRVPFGTAEEIKPFEVEVHGASPGLKTLTVAVADESLSDARVQYTWEVRAPSGPVLWVPDNASTAGRAFYAQVLDTVYGDGNWNTYEMRYGFPDREWVLLESMRAFRAVLWADGGATSNVLTRAAGRNGVLWQYVIPTAGQQPGSLLMVSKVITGSGSGISPAFMNTVLKIGSSPAPSSGLRNFSGLAVVGDDASLPPMTCTSNFAQALGLAPLAGAQWIYRFEPCCDRGCFGSTRALEPCDPITAVRWPLRADGTARAVAVSLQPEYFERAQAVAFFEAVLTLEMGVTAP
ncbi:MAG TPA: hypothetical protein PLQ13_01395 [Candidatus Krumholzibacteria bacterium]|nr:hypothetical protein [Candidatus Krumholzibacteria bacterium]